MAISGEDRLAAGISGAAIVLLVMLEEEEEGGGRGELRNRIKCLWDEMAREKKKEASQEE